MELETPDDLSSRKSYREAEPHLYTLTVLVLYNLLRGETASFRGVVVTDHANTTTIMLARIGFLIDDFLIGKKSHRSMPYN